MIDKITIVVVWYKKNQLDDFLDNINKQKDIDITVISLDNSQNQYVGAREAFNSVINKIDTDYVLFLHPDVYFEDNTILIKMLRLCWGVWQGIIMLDFIMQQLKSIRL